MTWQLLWKINSHPDCQGKAAPKTAASVLQEVCSGLLGAPPVFEVVQPPGSHLLDAGAAGSARRKKEAKRNAAAALLEHILAVSPGLVIRRYITLLNPTVARLHHHHQKHHQQDVRAVEGQLAAADPCSPVAIMCRNGSSLPSIAHKDRAPYRPMGKIALEEHIAFRDMWQLFNPPAQVPMRQLTDFEDGRLHDRLAIMDQANIVWMVVSMNGLTQSFSNLSTAAAAIRRYNQRLADAVAMYPNRLKFFCALPMFDVNASIAEVSWCMSRPGCPGALINGYSTDGGGAPNYYDSLAYDRFWSKVQELRALIYFHPRAAEPCPLFDKFPELMDSPWGFSVGTGEHMLRFILSGFFDKFPQLRFIIGHNGEIISYWAHRLDAR
eukprot:gene13543-13669_t